MTKPGDQDIAQVECDICHHIKAESIITYVGDSTYEFVDTFYGCECPEHTKETLH